MSAADGTEPIMADAEIADDAQPIMGVEMTDGSEPDVIEIAPVSVVDTTAELLGRAKPRAPRARAGRGGMAAAPATPSTPRGRTSPGSRKTAAKKPVAKRTTRSRKTSSGSDDDDFGNR